MLKIGKLTLKKNSNNIFKQFLIDNYIINNGNQKSFPEEEKLFYISVVIKTYPVPYVATLDILSLPPPYIIKN